MDKKPPVSIFAKSTPQKAFGQDKEPNARRVYSAPIQLVDEEGIWQGRAFSQDVTPNNEFSVIGIVGGHIADKSILLGHLLGSTEGISSGLLEKPHIEAAFGRIRAHVNRVRTIVLDCQTLGSFPLPSTPAAASLPPGISSAKLEPSLSWRQNQRLELQSFIFMLKACHTLVVISEGFDSSMWESLETAEMLSASVMDPSFYSKDAKEIAAASGKEYYAGLLFAHVNLTEAEASDRSMQHLQRALDAFFENSRLANNRTSHTDRGILLCTTGKPTPDLPSEAEEDWKRLAFKALSHARPKFHSSASEQAWLEGCRKLWQALNDSELLDSYIQSEP